MSLFKAQVNFINEWFLSIRPFFNKSKIYA